MGLAMSQPIISLYGPANRPQYWMDLYRSIGDNDVSFEIIFVGPIEPNYLLPNNFKFIKSNVKPAQCCEAASRYATGKLLLNVVDDIEFRTSNPLDKLYAEYVTYNDEKLILSCRYMMDGVDVSNECHRFYATDPNSPIMPAVGLVSKRAYRELGGIDRNFLGLFSDLDIAMRLYAIGGRVLLSNSVYINEVTHPDLKTSLLASEVGVHDRLLLNSLWVASGNLSFVRTRPFEPFSNERILEESQGPKGRWS
jgi:hypothetical protein